MCKHDVVIINDAKICKKCGLTLLNGKVFFDRKIVNYKPKKRGKKK